MLNQTARGKKKERKREDELTDGGDDQGERLLLARVLLAGEREETRRARAEEPLSRKLYQ